MACADAVTADLGSEPCDASCNAHARASARARELAQAQVPADEIEAAITCELELDPPEAEAIVTELADAGVLLRETRRGRAGLRAYLWEVAHGRVDVRTVTSATLAAATLLGKQHLGLDGVSPDAKVQALLRQAEVDAERRLANRDRKGRHLTVARSA